MKQRAVNFGVVGVYSIMYVFIAFLVAFIGFLAPWGWVYSSVLAAILGVIPYYKASIAFKSFGVGTIMSALLASFLLVSDESNLERAGMLVASGVACDTVRKMVGENRLIGVVLSYPILALGYMSWPLPMWTDPEWYYTQTVEELGFEYAKALKGYCTWGTFAIVAVLTLFCAVVSSQLAVYLLRSEDR